MALPFGVPGFIFGDIHDESGDGTNRGMRSGAVAGFVLVFLVIRLPAPSEFETGRLPVPRLVEKGSHLALLLMALEGEACFGGEHTCHDAQRKSLGEEGSFPEQEQKQGTPTVREDCP